MIFGYFFIGEGIKYFLEKVDKIQQKLTYEPTGCIIQNYRVTILEKSGALVIAGNFFRKTNILKERPDNDDETTIEAKAADRC